MIRVVNLRRAHAVQRHEGGPPQFVPIQNLHNAGGDSVIVHDNVEELVAACDLHCSVQVGLAAQKLKQNSMYSSVAHSVSQSGAQAAAQKLLVTLHSQQRELFCDAACTLCIVQAASQSLKVLSPKQIAGDTNLRCSDKPKYKHTAYKYK